MTAIEEASTQITGTKYELALVYQIDSRLVDWLLRDFPNARYSRRLSANDLPDVVLNQDLGFAESEAGAVVWRAALCAPSGTCPGRIRCCRLSSTAGWFTADLRWSRTGSTSGRGQIYSRCMNILKIQPR